LGSRINWLGRLSLTSGLGLLRPLFSFLRSGRQPLENPRGRFASGERALMLGIQKEKPQRVLARKFAARARASKCGLPQVNLRLIG
jgi:hypothetical protein